MDACHDVVAWRIPQKGASLRRQPDSVKEKCWYFLHEWYLSKYDTVSLICVLYRLYAYCIQHISATAVQTDCRVVCNIAKQIGKLKLEIQSSSDSLCDTVTVTN